jgi:hypothetical protein
VRLFSVVSRAARFNTARAGNADALPESDTFVAHVHDHIHNVHGFACTHAESQLPQQTAPDGHKHDSGGNAFSNDGDVFSAHG